MRCLRFLLVLVSLLSFSSTLFSQNPQSAPRIKGPVDESSQVVLKGNVPASARAEFDRGEAPASTQLSHVRLVLARSTEQQAALDKYDAELLDPSSLNYHKWLTPAQFGNLYGPADADVAAIVAWLQSHGMQVDPLEPGRTNISFSGSVAQIEEMLHTSIHSFEINGEQFFSNNTNPGIPAALAPVVSGVARLNTLKPKPHHVMGKMGLYDSGEGRMKPVPAAIPKGPRANLTTGSGTSSSPYTLYLVPGDAATIYDTPNTTLNANFSSGTNYTGQGVTIGVGGDAVIQPSTVLSYRQRFINTSDNNPPTITNVDKTTSTSDTDEAYIDNEISGGLAPDAKVHFYTASSIDVAIGQMLTDNSVDIFSLSFGLCELGLDSSNNKLINGWWQQAATQGIAVAVSTGDDGSAACDDNNTQTTAVSGLMVSGFASTPWNIAVGGTDLGGIWNSTAFTTYVSTTNSSGTLYRTALNYIPEWAWNDSVTLNETLSSNVPFVDSTGSTNIVAGSGGASNCSNNTNTASLLGACVSGYPKPAWQRGKGVPSDGARDLPDISLMAGAGGDNAAWLVCTDDSGPNSNNITITTDCTKQSDGHYYFAAFGGTSTSAPAFAGILALVQQKTGSRLGQAAQQLYDLYNGPNSAAIFHDTTIGNISVPCDSGTPNCQNNAAGNLFLTGYDTTAGYDLATGMGSVDAANLIKYWGTATLSHTATVTIHSFASNSITTTTPVVVSGTVAGASGTPTGSVVVIGAGYTSSAQNLSAGAFSVTVPAGSLIVGSDTITVNYSGDANFEPASASSSITVTGSTPTVAVSPSATSISVSGSLTVKATVSGSGRTPTGTVSLTVGNYGQVGGALSASGVYTFTVPPNSLSAGANQTVTVAYSGDTLYDAATGTSSVSVSSVGYALAASTPTGVTAGGSTTSTITVNSTTGYIGTVTLTCSVTGSPSGAVNPPQCTPTGTVVLSSTTTSATTKVNITTTGATAQLKHLGFPGSGTGAGGGLVLAVLVFCIIPARRRNRLSMFVLLLAMATLGGVAGCGGGGGGGGGGGTGTTAGTYTFTVSGTGSDSAKSVASTTFTLTVN